MVDTVRYLNPEGTLIKVEPEGWSMPYNSDTWHKAYITQWEEGRTDAWDGQKKEYDAYMLIMGYDAALLDYGSALSQCELDYSDCLAGPDPGGCDATLTECSVSLVYPQKPDGYYTQEEADDSVLTHAQWEIDKAVWESNPENEGQGNYPIVEPLILQIPEELTVVPEPAALVPNNIEPYDSLYGQTLEQVKQLKYIEIWQKADEVNHAAEATFFTKGVEIIRNIDRLNKKHSKIINKKIKGSNLSPEKEEFDDRYDQLLDYQDTVNDVADLSEDFVELMNDKYIVKGYDVESIMWPVWNL